MAGLASKIKEFISIETAPASLKLDRGNKKACIVSVCSQKGGVGKTTTAVNLGTAIAQFYNKKVLVCDLDPQGHVEKSVGTIIPEGVEYSPLSKVLMSKTKNILDGIVQTEVPNLSITPGDKELAEAENLLATKMGKEFFLQDALKLARTYYDLILIDCPPNLGNLTLNALIASDYCLVPCEASMLAFEGVNDLAETLDTVNERLNKKLKLLGIVMTRVDSRNLSMNRVIEDQLKKYFKGKVLETKIHVNTDLTKAQLEGRPIFDFAASSTGALNYKALAEEFNRRVTL